LDRMSGSSLRVNQRNKYQALWELAHGVAEVDTTPPDLQIARSNTCNFKCVYCVDHRVGNDVPRASLTGDTWDMLLALIPRSEQLMFHGVSEFLLDPEFFEIVARCGDAGASLCINTNGSVCTPKHMKALQEYPGFLTFVISVDAATPETFSRIRGWQFWRVVKNISSYVTSMKQRTGGTYMIMTFVVTKSSVGDVVPFIYLAKSLGVDTVRFYRLHEYDGLDWRIQTKTNEVFDYREEITSNFAEAYNRQLEAAKRAADIVGIRVELPALIDAPLETSARSAVCEPA
jgi:MoaA/NifB/PqqE/SkfB family radical SAM enzyme